MADDDAKDLLQQQYPPGDPRYLTADDWRAGTNWREQQAKANPYAAPPQPPAQYWENQSRPEPPRVQQEVAENISPTMGAYGATNTAGEFLHALYSGNREKAAELAPMALSIFAGVKAKHAPLDKLRIAEKMGEKGLGRDQIWNETGWSLNDGPGQGQPFFEINDSGLKKVAKPTWSDPSGSRVVDYWQHPKFYEQNPEAAAAAYRTLPPDYVESTKTLGGVNPATADTPATVFLADQWPKWAQGKGHSAKGTMVHEFDHMSALQSGLDPGARPYGAQGLPEPVTLQAAVDLRRKTKAIEDVIQGDINRHLQAYHEANPGVARDDPMVGLIMESQWAREHPEEWRALALARRYNSLSDDQLLMQAYLANRGEVRARNSATRMNMTNRQRLQTPPWQTEDVIEPFQWLASSYPQRATGGAVDPEAPETPDVAMARARERANNYWLNWNYFKPPMSTQQRANTKDTMDYIYQRRTGAPREVPLTTPEIQQQFWQLRQPKSLDDTD